jgi:hypothetical protein
MAGDPGNAARRFDLRFEISDFKGDRIRTQERTGDIDQIIDLDVEVPLGEWD